jgi:hypothetical protein
VIRRSWRTHLKGCTSPEAVLTVVSQFLDEWRPEEIAVLPAGAWPGPLRSKSDVLAHALKLNTMHAQFEGRAASLAGLQELLLFFTHASVRCNQLAAIASGGAEAPARDPGTLRYRKPMPDAEDDLAQ